MLNPSYAHNVNLSEVKLPGSDTVYYIKDADLRAIVEAFGTATEKDFLVGSIAANTTSGDLVTAAQIVAYLQAEIADLAGAMHFRGISTTNPDTGTVTVGGQVLVGKLGDVVLYGTKEFICTTAGSSEDPITSGTWAEIGDEGLWVPNTRTVAGIALNANIDTDDLKSALGLGAMSQVDQGTATYTPAGSITVNTTNATFNPGAVATPATTFNTDAIKCTVDGEQLQFVAAATGTALVASDITLPSLKDSSSNDVTSVATGIDSSTLNFSGTQATINVNPKTV